MEERRTEHDGLRDAGLIAQDLCEGDGMVDVRRGRGILAPLGAVFAGREGERIEKPRRVCHGSTPLIPACPAARTNALTGMVLENQPTSAPSRLEGETRLRGLGKERESS